MNSDLPAFDLAFALQRHGDAATLRLLAPIAVRAVDRARRVLLAAESTPLGQAEALHRLRGSASEIGLAALVASTRPLELALREPAGTVPDAEVQRLRQHCLACMDAAEAALAPWLPAA